MNHRDLYLSKTESARVLGLPRKNIYRAIELKIINTVKKERVGKRSRGHKETLIPWSKLVQFKPEFEHNYVNQILNLFRLKDSNEIAVTATEAYRLFDISNSWFHQKTGEAKIKPEKLVRNFRTEKEKVFRIEPLMKLFNKASVNVERELLRLFMIVDKSPKEKA